MEIKESNLLQYRNRLIKKFKKIFPNQLSAFGVEIDVVGQTVYSLIIKLPTPRNSESLDTIKTIIKSWGNFTLEDTKDGNIEVKILFENIQSFIGADDKEIQKKFVVFRMKKPPSEIIPRNRENSSSQSSEMIRSKIKNYDTFIKIENTTMYIKPKTSGALGSIISLIRKIKPSFTSINEENGMVVVELDKMNKTK